MDFALSEEMQLISDTVRNFVTRELYPHEDLVDRLDDVPAELAAQIRSRAIAAGLYAANMPAEHGGGGLGPVAMAVIDRELGRTGWGLNVYVARPSNILRACKGDQVSRYLLPTIRGERTDCLAMTEPSAGSDVRSMRTRAVRDGNDYVINGVKHFISHADVADYVILFAVTGAEDTPRGPRNAISAFLVDKGTPGFTITRGPSCVSHRGYHQCELRFADCRVSAGQLLGQAGTGFAMMGEWLSSTRIQVAATCVGRARRMLELATEWAGTRQQFGQVIGKFQGVSFQLADMAVEIEAADLLTMRSAWKLEKGLPCEQDIAMAKLYGSEMLARVTDRAVQIFGGSGLMQGTPVERAWRDARVERIWDGTSEVQRHILSRALLRKSEA